ncbi:hypothetical protein DMX02_14075 [Pseudomonas jessenii]|nr:hypothetical protein DMX02_14075 [Pseudomonas jessenii]
MDARTDRQPGNLTRLKNVGASLLAKRPAHSIPISTEMTPSRAGSLPQGFCGDLKNCWQSSSLICATSAID